MAQDTSFIGQVAKAVEIGRQIQEHTFSDYGGVINGAEAANQKKQILNFFHISSGKSVSFKAFLKSFNDNFSSNWGEETVYGRMDNIQKFSNTSRKISVEWVVPAASIEEARDNLHRCEHLFSMLYPNYEGNGRNANTISAAPLIKVKFANLIRSSGQEGKNEMARIGGLVTAIEGFTFNPDVNMGFYDVLDPSKGLMLFPKVISLNCTMRILHSKPVGWTKGGESGVQWIDGLEHDQFPYGVDNLTGKYSVEGPGGYFNLPANEIADKRLSNGALKNGDTSNEWLIRDVILSQQVNKP
jgi:hypothetical protein